MVPDGAATFIEGAHGGFLIGHVAKKGSYETFEPIKETARLVFSLPNVICERVECAHDDGVPSPDLRNPNGSPCIGCLEKWQQLPLLEPYVLFDGRPELREETAKRRMTDLARGGKGLRDEPTESCAKARVLLQNVGARLFGGHRGHAYASSNRQATPDLQARS